MVKRNDKDKLVRDPQKTARVLSGEALGWGRPGRWIIHEPAGGSPVASSGGTAQMELLRESPGYVRAETARPVIGVAYDRAPVHHVEIWRDPPSGGFHVRIFDTIV